MKNFIITIMTIFISIATISKAEENDNRDKLQLGFKFGVNYSNVYDTKGDNFDAESQLGLAFGGFVSVPIGSYFAIQPELLFSQKGYKATGKLLGLSYEFTHTSNWIDIPILFAFKPSPNIVLLAGPQYSYLLKKNYDFNNSAIPNIEQEFNDQNIRQNTLCFIGGMDFLIDNFLIGARVGWDLFNNNGDGTETRPRYKNVWVQAALGYRIVF